MAEDILSTIASRTIERVNAEKEAFSLCDVARRAEELASEESTSGPASFPFEKALLEPGMSFICEVKKASPSKGVISEDFPYIHIAKEYEDAGAQAISCLTEPYWFLGADKYLEEIAREVSIPVLRKDFVVDEYMVYRAKILGASAVLLICAILNDEELSRFVRIANSLGLSALVEAHDEGEIERALESGSRIIGVNNRNLKDFSVDVNHAAQLRSLVPADVIYVSESGISSVSDVSDAARSGADAVLIGEALMRAKYKKTLIEDMRIAARKAIEQCVA